jgi:hypothetical protein
MNMVMIQSLDNIFECNRGRIQNGKENKQIKEKRTIGHIYNSGGSDIFRVFWTATVVAMLNCFESSTFSCGFVLVFHCSSKSGGVHFSIAGHQVSYFVEFEKVHPP